MTGKRGIKAKFPCGGEDRTRRMLTKVLLLLLLQSMPLSISQKGQHALWKYIGGGNSHAPLRFDIDRILDSGCGLGEWTMVSFFDLVERGARRAAPLLFGMTRASDDCSAPSPKGLTSPHPPHISTLISHPLTICLQSPSTRGHSTLVLSPLHRCNGTMRARQLINGSIRLCDFVD